MPLEENAGQLFKGFSKLSRKERFQRLQDMGALNADDVKQLNNGQLFTLDLAEDLIENVIGYFQMPLGVAANFRIDNEDYAIPMAVEETSIIAAASKTAKWIHEHGSIQTDSKGDCIIGQIQISHVNDFDAFKKTIERNTDFLIETANQEVAHGLVKRGGGVKGLAIRKIDRHDDAVMAVIHVLMDPCDAMGANIMNQVCEYLKTPIEDLTDETVTMCILSNLNDHKLTRATVTLNDIDPDLGKRIEEASIFAECDPFRAATNNKGVLNGMDPILIATGNDWRAVEAGVHAYAARSGQYRSITQWRMQGKTLVGTLEAPIITGIVGGMTKTHPTAQLGLKMLNVENAAHLSRIVAAVGLVQNLGAIRALTTVGIIQGHMKLHIANLSLTAGANDSERPLLQQRLEEILRLRKRITLSNAIDVLNEIRKELTPSNKPKEQIV